MTQPPIRAAVVGLGWAARSIWLPRLSAHPAFRVVAAVDPAAAARKAARPYAPDAGLLADPDELRPRDVDFAVVAVPNHLHGAVASRLLRRGVPVFVEKPVCLSSAEADELAAAERAGGAVLLAGSAARHRADVDALRTTLASLGTIRHLDLSWVRARGVPDGVGWFTRLDLAGGGALVDLGWHLLDVAEPLLGAVRVTQAVGAISADFVNSTTRRAAWRSDDTPRLAAGDVEDTMRGFLVTDTGVSISVRAAWASHRPRDVTVLGVEGSAGSATLRCTFGFSPNRLEASSLTRWQDGRVELVPLPAMQVGEEYDRQLDALPAALAGSDSFGRATAEARRTIDVIERLYASATAGPAAGGRAPGVAAHP